MHTIYHFQYKKENHPNLSQICSYGVLFQGTQEGVQNSRGKRAISFRATDEALLYLIRGLIKLRRFAGKSEVQDKSQLVATLCSSSVLVSMIFIPQRFLTTNYSNYSRTSVARILVARLP